MIWTQDRSNSKQERQRLDSWYLTRNNNELEHDNCSNRDYDNDVSQVLKVTYLLSIKKIINAYIFVLSESNWEVQGTQVIKPGHLY
jgi:hypothetical protein